MTTKATDSVLNLVTPPISNIVTTQGTLNNTTIGVSVPNVGYFTENHATRQWINGVELIMLNGTTTFYVATSGTDIAGNGLTIGTPWRTRQYAYNYILNHYHLAGNLAIIQLADGTYNDSCSIGGRPAGLGGPGAIVFQGNLVTPQNCRLVCNTAVTGGYAFLSTDCSFTVRGFHIEAVAGTSVGSGQGIYAGGGSIVFMDTCDMGPCSGSQLFCIFGGEIYAANYFIGAGTSANHVTCTEHSTFYNFPQNGGGTTVVGAHTFTNAYANVSNLSYCRMIAGEVTFVGNSTGPKFLVSGNAVLNTNFSGGSFLPGTSGGSTSSGGIYF